MAFRVTNNLTTESFIDQILRNRLQLEVAREEISTGLKVGNPSDDPGRSGTIVNLVNTSQRIDRHIDRVTYATSFLEAQEGAVQSANNVMIRLQELAEQAANGTNTPDVKAQIADEVFQLRDTLASLGNTRYQDLYLFGGLDDADPPFDYDADYFDQPPAAVGSEPPEKGYWVMDIPGVLNSGDPSGAQSDNIGQYSTRTISISDTDSVRINTPANQIFERALNAATRLGRSLEGYQTIRDAADADGDGSTEEFQPASPPQLTFPADQAVQNGEILAALEELRVARVNDLEVELSSIGARMNRLTQTSDILETLRLNTETARASLQDADPFESATRFTLLQTGLQALLASGAQINNLSLLNFI